MTIQLTPSQTEIAYADAYTSFYISGPAGCGKTFSAVSRIFTLLKQGIPGDSILLLTPQRTLQEPYLDAIHTHDHFAGGPVTPATVGGIARRIVHLFWPLAAEKAGFQNPELPPTFLTLETAQYYMAHLVRPLIEEQGYFDSITINHNRLYSQIIDNLNKAASVGFPHTEIGARLASAWSGDPAQRRIYQDTQECAELFRQYCLKHNLLDFSLQLEIFWHILWHEPLVREHLSRSYQHLIYDNTEEDPPIAHDLIEAWLPDFDSALVITDEDGGYRRFLGADPKSALRFADLIPNQRRLDVSLVTSPEILSLSQSLTAVINTHPIPSEITTVRESRGQAFSLMVRKSESHEETLRYYPELLDAVSNEIEWLLSNDIEPADIVVIAPYLSDSLRFSLTNRLESRSIPWRSHRPSRSLQSEPATSALMTLSSLAHPEWHIQPSAFDIANMLLQSIDGIDPVRANLLTRIVYNQRRASMTSFEAINPEHQERITYLLGSRFERLRQWLLAYAEDTRLPLDHFLRKLFGELLSQPGYGFHKNEDAIRIAASLVESAQKFRQGTEAAFQADGIDPSPEFIKMLNDGVIAAQYLEGWQTTDKNAVLIAPAYTFLMMNQPVRFQFWLDAGSSGWYERLSQPLTQPFVLSRDWHPHQVWTDTDEVRVSNHAISRLIAGLLLRCKERIYLGISELGESGYEQRGILLKAFQRILTEGN